MVAPVLENVTRPILAGPVRFPALRSIYMILVLCPIPSASLPEPQFPLRSRSNCRLTGRYHFVTSGLPVTRPKPSYYVGRLLPQLLTQSDCLVAEKHIPYISPLSRDGEINVVAQR